MVINSSIAEPKVHRQIKLHYDTACVVCGAPPGEQIGEVTEHEYTTTTTMSFPMVRCQTCRLVYPYPRPDISELDTIYPPDYYAYHMSEESKTTGKKSFFQQLLYKLLGNGLRNQIMPNLKALPKDRPLRVLDIGCGVGAQLDLVREFLDGAQTYGVEVGEAAALRARTRGHEIYHGLFEDVDLPKNFFDVIISIHVIEHVDRPDLFLEKAREVLTDDGIILIETPNTDCPDFEMFKGKHWGGYHAPRHWYLFQAFTFEKLARRLKLKVVKSDAHACSVFWNWTCHSLVLSAFGRKIADKLFPPVTIFYGGLQSFAILGFFGVFERILQKFTGKASALFIVFAKD